MSTTEIYLKINDVFKELLSLLMDDELETEVANTEIRRLYREYLKLYVKVSRMIPKYDDGKFKGNMNCYFYALDLSLPNVFKNSFERITGIPFCTNIGELSALKYYTNIH